MKTGMTAAQSNLSSNQNTDSGVAAVRSNGPGQGQDPTLLALVQSAQGGDIRAAQMFLDAIRPRALAVALKVLKNVEDAEDAVQEAQIKIWRAIPAFLKVGRTSRRGCTGWWLTRVWIFAGSTRVVRT